MAASIKHVREFITNLGFEPEEVYEVRIDGHSVIVFYIDEETGRLKLSKMPIIEVLENVESKS